MSTGITFVAATPARVADTLTSTQIHLWRMPYAPSERRAPLKRLLAAYLDANAADLMLHEDARGKPRLAHASTRATDEARLEFNWSHSGCWALVALARGQALGVDVERFGKQLRSKAIARRFFDPAEADTLATLDGVECDRAFIGLWCAKEAVLKAVGEGLSFGLARLGFSRRDDADWSLVRTDPLLGDASQWQVAGFEAAPAYRGALAWRGDTREVLAFDLIPR